MPSPSRSLFPLSHAKLPEHYLIAHSDGGARGNPGPAGYGVVIQDERGQKVATLSQYLGHQTNNFAEYQGLIAALEYAIEHGHKAHRLLHVVVHDIDHALREHNREADDLANQAMDKGTGRVVAGDSPARSLAGPQEFEGVVQGGVIKLLNGQLPEGTRVQLRIKK